MLFAERPQVPGFTASSAGTRALVGHPIHPESVRVIERLGGDASNFSARRLTTKIASGADLILTMTRGQNRKVGRPKTHGASERANPLISRTLAPNTSGITAGKSRSPP